MDKPFRFTVSYISIEEGAFCLSLCAASSSRSHSLVLSLKCILRAWYALALVSKPTSKRFHRFRRDGTVEFMLCTYAIEQREIYQSGPASSSLNGSCESPRPPAYGLGTCLGCFWRHCSMEPTRSLLFLRPPVLPQGCSSERIGEGRNPDGHECGINQFPSGVPRSWAVRALDCSLPTPGSEPCIDT
jgi:hypothetical protein